MITLQNLGTFLDDYLYFDKRLNVVKIDPSMANGLMIKGREKVKKVGFGVSASISLFEEAKKMSCDVIVTHHSFNLPPFNQFDPIFQKRIGFLIQNDLSLFGYHFLLDSHPEVGNNIQILKTIGAKPSKPYFHQGDPWGWTGNFEEEVSLQDIENKSAPFFSPRTIQYTFGPEKIKKVVVISGNGAPRASGMSALITDKVDLFITGEVHEWNRELFKEAKIHFIAGGHYATEMFGIKALMEKVKNTFPSLETVWLDIGNEV